MQRVLYAQIISFKLQDSLMFWELCFWNGKFSFVNYLVNKSTLSDSENKKNK